MNSKAVTSAIFVAAIMCSQSAWAINFGRNVTIPDNDGVVGEGSWYEKTHEDDEVEPYTQASQQYDLEGFFLQGTRLTMVGGYDYWNQSYGTRPGDLFLGLGDVRYGDGFHPLGTIHDDGWYMRNES